ncbi:MAG: hypothetical protein WC980_04170 [Candidatus Brocadiia bacterium]
MILYALVKKITGKSKNYWGIIKDDQVIQTEEMPPAKWVVIEKSDKDGFYLFRYDEKGEFAGDTLHDTIEKAKEQADFEYEIKESNWIEGNPPIDAYK